MQSAKVFLGIVFFVYIAVIFITLIKSKRFFAALLLTALQGVCALFAVNFAGTFLSVHIPVNGWTVGISSIGGVSGVIMLLLCDVFMA